MPKFSRISIKITKWWENLRLKPRKYGLKQITNLLAQGFNSLSKDFHYFFSFPLLYLKPKPKEVLIKRRQNIGNIETHDTRSTKSTKIYTQ